jgi:hypothetical protein
MTETPTTTPEPMPDPAAQLLHSLDALQKKFSSWYLAASSGPFYDTAIALVRAHDAEVAKAALPPAETVECSECDCGVSSLREAVAEGWTQLQSDDGPGWNYLGLCPVCQAPEEAKRWVNRTVQSVYPGQNSKCGCKECLSDKQLAHVLRTALTAREQAHANEVADLAEKLLQSDRMIATAYGGELKAVTDRKIAEAKLAEAAKQWATEFGTIEGLKYARGLAVQRNLEAESRLAEVDAKLVEAEKRIPRAYYNEVIESLNACLQRAITAESQAHRRGEALKPFADASKFLPVSWDDDGLCDSRFKAGTLRAAAAALDDPPKPNTPVLPTGVADVLYSVLDWVHMLKSNDEVRAVIESHKKDILRVLNTSSAGQEIKFTSDARDLVEMINQYGSACHDSGHTGSPENAHEADVLYAAISRCIGALYASYPTEPSANPVPTAGRSIGGVPLLEPSDADPEPSVVVVADNDGVERAYGASEEPITPLQLLGPPPDSANYSLPTDMAWLELPPPLSPADAEALEVGRKVMELEAWGKAHDATPRMRWDWPEEVWDVCPDLAQSPDFLNPSLPAAISAALAQAGEKEPTP